ncbi:hypothetical protein AS159_04890 [Thermotoga sp. Ku-13t]|uniref:hypothetical protein n=1 Tax=Thermotoga sp. Ku-13t TaxID=1755813 RepID=UPI0013EACA21|nr:hypothetical protein [Thermotoga sp. Ku-13t]KAF2957753.1 hypothetical protein AS159_04890 [Thermotoga sp. Ku-13t]
MYGPYGLGMRCRHGWHWHGWHWHGHGFGWTCCPWRRHDKESLREYRKWLEEEIKYVDEALKESETVREESK